SRHTPIQMYLLLPLPRRYPRARPECAAVAVLPAGSILNSLLCGFGAWADAFFAFAFFVLGVCPFACGAAGAGAFAPCPGAAGAAAAGFAPGLFGWNGPGGAAGAAGAAPCAGGF